ncbi:hypothetical protein PTKIN_Ptkin17bG0099400 [Pterospermum kingtungense]
MLIVRVKEEKKAIGIADSNLAELFAIRETFILFAATQWSWSHKLFIESDSTNVVKWVNSPSSIHWAMQRFINHIECLKNRIISWKVAHVSREVNHVADALAKEVAHKRGDLIEFL